MRNPTPGRDLFTYGSLMCEDIMAEVAGERLRCSPAELAGYRRFLVKDEMYPGLVADPTGTVAGLVYYGITDRGWSRLDRFEGTMYARIPVSVQDESNTLALVSCYVFRLEFHHLLTATEWDFAAFLRSGKTTFLNQYCGFKAID